MLHTPLYLLSYIDKRLQYNDRIFSVNELTILSYHIKRNLWIGDNHDFVQLHEDISADLDAAMLVRREGLPGQRTPDGILTRFTNTSLGQLISRIEASDNEHSVDFGFLLLTLSEETLEYISNGIDRISAMTISDGGFHDLTVGIGDANAGLTIHCSLSDIDISSKKLKSHCEIRKYSQNAREWYGILLRPNVPSPIFGVSLKYPWKKNAKLDYLVSTMPKGMKFTKRSSRFNMKIGRNDPCPCGSGKKFKRCCL
ncbi:SEC-C metal-binding domain-containing protein [Methylobacterium haplocladii]|uniref:SEC-C metal-binding domain-containing protein n=1 Tax=Methylobacterium haplocladii TaxID=1176176 RepID=UPI001478C244|nr:SEC-C metal-binding domain-containing protein [Methylobacterium haplocladii]